MIYNNFVIAAYPRSQTIETYYNLYLYKFETQPLDKTSSRELFNMTSLELYKRKKTWLIHGNDWLLNIY